MYKVLYIKSKCLQHVIDNGMHLIIPIKLITEIMHMKIGSIYLY